MSNLGGSLSSTGAKTKTNDFNLVEVKYDCLIFPSRTGVSVRSWQDSP